MSKPVFIHGGYQSADIILTDALNGSHPPLAGQGGATPLVANRQYYVQARVFNSFPGSVGILIYFYEAPGGFGSLTTFLPGVPVSRVIPANATMVYPENAGGNSVLYCSTLGSAQMCSGTP